MKRTCNGCNALGLDAISMKKAVCMLGKEITDDERGAKPAEECDKPKTKAKFDDLLEQKTADELAESQKWEPYVPNPYKVPTPIEYKRTWDEWTPNK